MNSNDEIIGGEWISDERPDFVWTQERPVFRGYWQKLEAIYSQSTGGQTPVPQPTVLPTVGPTAGPTAAPTAGPTARPTAMPTVRPTFAPQPQPPVPPVGNPGQYVCQQGLTLQEFDIAQGKGYVCTDSNTVQQGSVTNSMMQFCASAQGWSECSADKWDVPKFKTYRGSDVCPAGSIVDKETLLCKEGDHVVGPFNQTFVQACLAAVQDGTLCYSASIKHDFAAQLLQGQSGKGKRKSK
ncbi:MAG: PT domain-containing protein [Silvanigrellales bacterium]|nr:PT domain-containing protein [Silvanigrellales bacterium]